MGNSCISVCVAGNCRGVVKITQLKETCYQNYICSELELKIYWQNKSCKSGGESRKCVMENVTQNICLMLCFYSKIQPTYLIKSSQSALFLAGSKWYSCINLRISCKLIPPDRIVQIQSEVCSCAINQSNVAPLCVLSEQLNPF